MELFLELALSAGVVIFVWRFVNKSITSRRTPPDTRPEDPYARVGAPLKPRPSRNASAVALEEPHDD